MTSVSSKTRLWGYQCFTCGEIVNGLTSLFEADDRADEHVEAARDYIHCYACGDRPNGCPRCADESGVK